MKNKQNSKREKMVETKSLSMIKRSESVSSTTSSSQKIQSFYYPEMLINSSNMTIFNPKSIHDYNTSENRYNLLNFQKQLKVVSPTKSSFTIDNILATNKSRFSESPSSSPTYYKYFKTIDEQYNPTRPLRVPAAILHHSGLHLSKIAAAASGFNSPSELFGKSQCIQLKMETNRRINYKIINITN